MAFENIVFSGGGIRGLSYIGVLKALKKLDKIKDIKKIIGTSIGSVFALLCICNCTNNELDTYFELFQNQVLNNNDNILTESINLYKKMGLHDNENIYNTVNCIIESKLNIKNITFSELYEYTNIEYTVIGTCLSTRKIEYFNYIKSPNMEIAKAIQISTSIPFYYTMTEWNNKKWADGGICKNFPIDYYDEEDGSFNDKTLGFYLKCKEKKHYEINTFLDIIKSIENTELDRNILDSINKTDKRNIIVINSEDISLTDFDLSENQKQILSDTGFNQTIKYFKNKQDEQSENINNDEDYWSMIKSMVVSTD